MKRIKKIFRRFLELLRGEPQNINKLYKRGLKVGRNFNRMGGVIIDPSHCYHITIGDNVTLAPRVHILAHDSSVGMFTNKIKAANVTIGDNVFVGASAIILPGVHIGNRVIIGAGSVVTKDVPSNSVVAGNPARIVCSMDEYEAKIKSKMCQENTFKDLDWDKPEDIAKAVAAADEYGEIFVGE